MDVVDSQSNLPVDVAADRTGSNGGMRPPDDLASIISAAVAQSGVQVAKELAGVMRDLQPAKPGVELSTRVARLALAVSLLTFSLLAAVVVYHEARTSKFAQGQRASSTALEILADVVMDHASYSEAAFEAQAKGEPPPPRPDRTSKAAELYRALGRGGMITE